MPESALQLMIHYTESDRSDFKCKRIAGGGGGGRNLTYHWNLGSRTHGESKRERSFKHTQRDCSPLCPKRVRTLTLTASKGFLSRENKTQELARPLPLSRPRRQTLSDLSPKPNISSPKTAQMIPAHPASAAPLSSPPPLLFLLFLINRRSITLPRSGVCLHAPPCCRSLLAGGLSLFRV